MLGEQRRAVVVVARIGRLDTVVWLRRQRGDYVREHIVRQPCHTVVVGLARPHPVTGDASVTNLAVGALARVIPCRPERAGRADREVGLPLRTVRGIGVQLHRRAKGHTAVGGADVIDIARVTASAVLRIDQVNDIVECSRLTPALVPPVAAVIRKHAGEVADSCHARSREAGAGVGVGPCVATVRGPINMVDVVVGEATAAFVHPGDVNIARNLVGGDLDVPDEGVGNVDRGGPSDAVIAGVGGANLLALSEVIPGSVHSTEKWRRWVVIRVARLAVVTGTLVNASTNRPGDAAVSGLPGAKAKTAAARSDINCKESAGRFVVENNRVAKVRAVATAQRTGEDAGESGAAVTGVRYTGIAARGAV